MYYYTFRPNLHVYHDPPDWCVLCLYNLLTVNLFYCFVFVGLVLANLN